MPEAKVLYAVTALVVSGLLVWVLFVLKTAKEPWARPLASRAEGPAAEEGAATEAPPASEAPPTSEG